MGQSLVKIYVHIIFSTKHREPLILPAFEESLQNYLGGICRNLDWLPLEIGGDADHVHVFCVSSKRIPLVKLVEVLKSDSSKWMKSKDKSLKDFYWQDGYGAFSVNPTEVNLVKKYVSNQHAHHQKKTFQDEYRSFLNKYQIDFDERYVWG